MEKPVQQSNTTSEESKKLATDISQCAACELRKTCSQPVPGEFAKGIDVLFLGEAPGEEEDKQHRPFVGRSGQLLRSMLVYLGNYKYGITNAVKCRPPQNRTPTYAELKACHVWTEKIIALCAPKVIVCVGRPATNIIAQSAGKKVSNLVTMAKLAGSDFFSEKYKATVYTIYHPAFALRKRTMKAELETQIIYLAKSLPGWILRAKEAETCVAEDQVKSKGILHS